MMRAEKVHLAFTKQLTVVEMASMVTGVGRLGLGWIHDKAGFGLERYKNSLFRKLSLGASLYLPLEPLCAFSMMSCQLTGNERTFQ